MPKRYHVPIAPAPARFRPVGKYGTVDWREDCSRCRNCVKTLCVYGVYRTEHAYNTDPSAPIEPLFDCRSCLSCIQGCTKGLLSLSVNPEYVALGDDYWRPDIIATTWEQADTGRIPVSGAGYRGPFQGPGFDSIWTDMSEIVRPTRDGIHGREYINTSVDIGSKPTHLVFGSNGEAPEAEPLLELPIPVILDVPPWDSLGEALSQARIAAGTALGTLSIVRPDEAAVAESNDTSSLVPLFDEPGFARYESLLHRVRMVEIAEGPDMFSRARELRAVNGDLVVCARIPLEPDAIERVWALYEGGLKVIHLCADTHGREIGAERPRYVKDVLREIHGRLVQEGVRDEVTLILSGGIALAEHVAKAIICGADLVAVGLPLMIALGCRLCPAGHNGSCPAGIQDVDAYYAAQRMVNLMGAWHSQLIEVLGAMGIREVRRLRGEVGRAMFQEDLEREAFGDLGN
jgi:ferredoxin